MEWLIDFAPVAGAPLNEISVSDKVITVDGDPHDFSFMEEGDLYPASAIPGASAWLRSTEITLWEGTMRCCVVTPKAPPDAPVHVRHPGPVTVASGRVPHPIEELADADA